MSLRDPKADPIDGDVLAAQDGSAYVIVDLVQSDRVYYRVVRDDALLDAVQVSLDDWRRMTDPESVVVHRRGDEP